MSAPNFGLVNGVKSLSLLNDGNSIYTAPLSNLKSWQKINSFPNQRQQNILYYSAATPAWLTVGNDNSIYSSPDGLNWEIISQRDRSNRIPNIGGVYRADAINQWLLISQQVTSFSGISYSTDGILWNKANIPNTLKIYDFLYSAAYSASEKKYLVLGETSGGVSKPILISSSDGKSWNTKNSNTLSRGGQFIFYNEVLKQWIISGDNILFSSSNGGSTWVPAAGDPVTSTGLRGVAWSNDLNQYLVAGRRLGKEVLYKSNDGLNWTRQTFSVTGWLRGAAYSPTKKMWVVVGYGGAILTSSDGNNWTHQTWKSDQTSWDLWSVYWDESLQLWIATGGSISQYEGNILIYSSNGKDWKISTNKQLFLTTTMAIKQ